MLNKIPFVRVCVILAVDVRSDLHRFGLLLTVHADGSEEFLVILLAHQMISTTYFRYVHCVAYSVGSDVEMQLPPMAHHNQSLIQRRGKSKGSKLLLLLSTGQSFSSSSTSSSNCETIIMWTIIAAQGSSTAIIHSIDH